MREDPISRMSQRWLKDLNEEIAGWLQEATRGIVNPEDLMKLAGMAKQGVALNPYQILSLSPSASDGEVKRRYRELLHYLHPDTSGVKGTETLLQMVMAAYETIKRERGWQ